MNSQFFLYCCLGFTPIHFIFSAILSKELFAFENNKVKLAALTLVVWLIPILGSFCIYKFLDLKWFEAPVDDNIGNQSFIGGGMMEMNAILNSEHRHVVEAKERETVELNLDGELYDRKSKKELIEKNM